MAYELGDLLLDFRNGKGKEYNLRLDLLEKYFLELSRWTKFSTELNRV
jgi:hypothetical protein